MFNNVSYLTFSTAYFGPSRICTPLFYIKLSLIRLIEVSVIPSAIHTLTRSVYRLAEVSSIVSRYIYTSYRLYIADLLI